MDTTLLIEIIIAVVIVWLFIKFIASPAIKLILGIIIFLFLLYLLQRLFGLDIDRIFASIGIHTNLDNWATKLGSILAPLNPYIDRVKSFFNYIWANVPKP